jgi:hypothetical protein
MHARRVVPKCTLSQCASRSAYHILCILLQVRGQRAQFMHLCRQRPMIVIIPTESAYPVLGFQTQVEGQRVEVAQQAATKAALSKLDRVKEDINARAEALGREADAEENKVRVLLL